MGAVILVINHKQSLSHFEKISLQQCVTVLNRHPIWMIVPKYLDTAEIEQLFPSINILRVANKYLSNYRNFNRFKINPFLYKHFAKFEYILYYELDAFVFEDQLDYWCSLGYDFIGAPWLVSSDAEGHVFNGVGNGGFSLRKISSHSRVLRSFRKLQTVNEILYWYKGFNTIGRILYFPQLVLRLIGLQSNTLWCLNDFKNHEDEFWSKMSQLFPWFRIPNEQTALKFSFELYPDILYAMNEEKLPFGCHAWYKNNHLEFWKPFFQEAGYVIENENN